MAKVRQVGKYEIISKIAEGGMGAVYKAKHPTLNRYILLKKLTLRGGSQFIERFKREARIMMDFKHEHIVQVYDHFKEGGSYYIAEEFVDGLSLDRLIKQERYLSNEAVMLILYEVAKGLKHAHDKKVIHRDIKPANILISRQGEVKLVDFGIATSLEEEDGLTREGMTLGTPSYIPPEQIENAKHVDKRADIYSLGVMLYEMLTGKTPFPGTFTAESIALIHKGKYISPQKLNPQIAPVLRRIIRRAMQPKRNKRYKDLKPILKLLGTRIKRRDPASLRRAIRNYIQGKDIGDIYRRKRSWVGNLAAGVALLCLLSGGGYYLYRAGYYHEYFRSRDYGALITSTRIERVYKRPEEVFIRGVLYRQEQDQLVRQEEVDFGFHENAARGDETSFVLESRKLYLPPGYYRLKLNLEGELYWQSFFLNPRSLQKKQPANGGALQIHLPLEPNPHLPLTVRYAVYDQESGANLAAGTRFSILRGSQWIPWNRRIAASLKSGNIYQFKFERQGYHPQSYHLRIQPYQSLLRLEARLTPIPGTLRISANQEGLKLLINGSSQVMTGGRERAYRKLDRLGPEAQSILLSPGEYLLTVRRSDSLQQGMSIKIEPGETVRVKALFDQAEKSLSLEIAE